MKEEETKKILSLFRKSKVKKTQLDFDQLPRFLTLDQVGEILGVHPNTLRNWDRSKKLVAVRIGTRQDRRYPREKVYELYVAMHGPSLRDRLRKWVHSIKHVSVKIAHLLRIVKKKEQALRLSKGNPFKQYSFNKRGVVTYSVLVAVVIFFWTITNTPFGKIFSVNAEGDPNINLTLEPATCFGWENTDNAKELNGLSQTPLTEFLETNSASTSNQRVFTNIKSHVSQVIEDTKKVSNLQKAATGTQDETTTNKHRDELTCQGYVIQSTLPEGSELNKARLRLSLGVDAPIQNTDVITISYSIGGSQWTVLDSFPAAGTMSNETHKGFWEYDLTNVKNIEELSTLNMRVTYSAFPSTQDVRVYVDGMSVATEIRKPVPKDLSEEIAKNLTLPQGEVAIKQLPTFDLNIEQKSSLGFLGVDPTKREIKSIKLHDANGGTKEIEPKVVSQIAVGKVTQAKYQIPQEALEHPGKYSVTLEVEQNGYIKTVSKDFSWGVLGVNVRKSVTTPDVYTELHMSVLDDYGKTICDAQLDVTLVHPGGYTEKFASADKTVIRNPDCRDHNFTYDPDYSAFFTTTKIGTYNVTVTAVTKNGTHTIYDSFKTIKELPFDLERTKFPTRIFPRASYPVTFTITAKEDFDGVFIEKVPIDFTITDVSDHGVEGSKGLDPDTKTISWPVSFVAGKTYTLSYTFKAPLVVPESYLLGPATAGEFEESRAWQIVSDATCISGGTGNWRAITWTGGCGTYPVAGDAVTIRAGDQVTIPASETDAAASLAIAANNNATQSQLNFTAADSILNLTSTIVISAPTNASGANLNIGPGTINSATTVTINGGAGINADITISTGLLDLSSNFAAAGGTAANARVNITNASGRIMVGGNLAFTGTYVTTSGKITLDGGSAQTIAVRTTYPTIDIANTSGGVQLSAGTTTCAALTVTTGTLDIRGVTFTVSGTTTVSNTGTLTLTTSTTGTKTFTGKVTVNNGGTWSNPVNEGQTFSGGIQNDGSFNAGAVALTFATSMSLSGSAAMTFGSTIAISSGITITNQNTGGVSIASNVTGGLSTSTWINGDASNAAYVKFGGTVLTTGTLTPAATANTIEYSGGAQTQKVPTTNNYYHLSFTGSGTKTLLNSLTAINGNLSVSCTTTCGATQLVGLSVAGTMTITASSNTATWTTGAFALTVTGKTTIQTGGNITINSATGTKAFNGDLQVDLGGTWNCSTAVSFTLPGNVTNNGTFTPSTGTYTFSGSNKTIAGTFANAFTAVTISGGGTQNNTGTFTTATLTVNAAFANTGTITVTSALAGSNTLTQGTNGTLNINVAAASYTLTGLVATATGNTVSWGFAGAQTVFNTTAHTYYHLNLLGSGAKTLTGLTDVTGNFSIAGSATATFPATVTIGGNLSITGTAALTGSSSNLTVGGNWTNSSSYTHNSGTVTLNGSAQQTIAGTLTGATGQFNNLTITNSSGTNPVSSPSVIFSASAQTAATFTAATAGTKIRFLASGTYTFVNFTLTGTNTSAMTRVFLRSSSEATSWGLAAISGSISATYVDVADSNSTTTITCNTSCVDQGGNTNWSFNTTNKGVTGFIYTDDTLAFAFDCSANPQVIEVSLNQSATLTQSLCTQASGQFYVPFNTAPAAGNDVVVYSKQASPPSGVTPRKMAVVTRASANANISSNADLMENVLFVGTKQSNTITNATIDAANAGTADTGVLYTTSGSTDLTLTTGVELYIQNGKAYTAGGNLTTSGAGLKTASTAVTLDGSSNTLDGNVAVNNVGSTLTINGDTTITGNVSCTNACRYTSGTPTITLIGSGKTLVWLGSGGSGPMYNLVIGDGSTSTSYTLNTYVLSVKNTMTVTNAATFTETTNLTVTASLTCNSGSTFNYTGTPTLTKDGTGNIGGSGSTVTIYNLTTSGTGNTTLASAITADNVVTVGTGTTLTVNGDLLVNGGQLINTTTGIITTSTNASNTVTLSTAGASGQLGGGVGAITLGNIDLFGTGTITQKSPVTLNGAFTVNGGGTTFDIQADLIVGAYAGSHSISTTGSVFITTSTGSPTLTTRNTVSISTGGIGTPSYTFYNLNVGDGTATGALSSSREINVTNDVTVTTGSSFAMNITNIGGNLTTVGTGSISSTLPGQIITMTGASDSTPDIGGAGASGTIYIGGLALTGTTSATIQKAISIRGDITLASGTTLNANNNVTVEGGDVTGDGTLTYTGTPTFTLSGSGNFGGATAWSFYNLYFSLSAGPATTTAVGAGDITINNVLTLVCGGSDPCNDFRTLNAGSKLWILTGSGTPFVNWGRLIGASSTFRYTGSTVSVVVALANNISLNYYNNLELKTASSYVTYTLGGKLFVNGDLTAGTTNVAGEFYIDGDTYHPDVTIAGNITGFAGGYNQIYSGTGTWTVGGDVDFSLVSYSSSGNTLVMNGTGTYTNAGSFIDNLTLTGTITMATEISYVRGDLVLGGTLTHGSSTIIMAGTANTITGGGQTLYNLTINPATTGTITLQTSDLTVANNLTISTLDTLVLDTGRTLVLSGTSGTTLTFGASTAHLNGPGRLTYRSSTAFPTGGSLGASLIVRYDMVTNAMTSAVRTDYGYIEAYNSSGSSRSLTLGNGTHTLAADFTVMTAGAGQVLIAGNTNNPAINIGGSLACSTTSSGTRDITTGSNTWTVSANVDFTNCTTVTTTNNTLVMNGTGTLTSNAKILNNVTLSGTITLANASHTLTGNLNMAGGTVTAGTSTVLMYNSTTLTGGGQTLYNLTIGDGTSTVATLQTSDVTVSNTLVLTASDALTISSGITLNHTGATLTLNDGTINGPGRYVYRSSTAFPTGGSLASGLILQFDTTSNNQTMSARTDYQYIEIENSGSTAGRTVTSAAGIISFANNLTLLNSGTGSSTTTLDLDTNDPTITVTGNTSIAADTVMLASSANAMTVRGNFTNSGTFTHNSGTVNFSGVDASTQIITGDTTFNNFSATTTANSAGRTLQFAAGSTTTVAGTWTINGASGKVITLQSSAASVWNINPSATSVTYVAASYSNNQGATFCATFSTDGGDNVNWSFSAGASCNVTISGTVYSDEGSSPISTPTCDDSTTVVRVRVESMSQTSIVKCNSGYTTTVFAPPAGKAVIVYLDNVTANATTVVRYSGSGNVTADLYQNRVVVRSDDASPITNTNIDGYDSGNEGDGVDGDVGYTVTTGALTVSNTRELHVASGTSGFTTGGTVTTNLGGAQAGTGGDVHIVASATLAMGSNALSVGGDYTNAGTATFTSGQTATFTATGTGFSIDPGSSSFANVTFNGSGGGWTNTASMTVGNNLSVSAGTFTANTDLTVNGDAVGGVTVTGGAFNVTSGTVAIGNGTDEKLSLSGGDSTISGGTVDIKDDLLIGSASSDLVVSNATVNVNGNGANSNITHQGGNFTINAGALVNFSGLYDKTGGTLNLEGGSLSGTTTTVSHFQFDGGTVNLDGGDHYTGQDSIVELARGGSGNTFNMTGGNIYTRALNVYNSSTLTTTTVTGGTIHIGRGGTSTSTSFYDTNVSTHSFYNISMDDDGKRNDGAGQQVFPVKGTFTIASGKTFTANGFNIRVDGGWVNHGTLVPQTGKIILRGGNISGDSNSTFYNLDIGDGTTSNAVTVSGTDYPTVQNTLLIDTGDALTLNSGTTLTHSGATLTLNGTLNGPGRYIYQSGTIFPTTGTLASNLILRYDATSTDQLMRNRTDYQIIEIYSSSNTTDHTVTMSASTHTISGGLFIIADGTNAIALIGTNNPTVNIGGNISFTKNSTGVPSSTSGTGTWTVSGNVDFSNGTYTATSGNTLLMDGTSNAITGNAQSLYNFTVDPSSAGTITLQTSDLTVSNTLNVASSDSLTINSGRNLDHTGSTLTLAGTINGPGRYTYFSTTAFPTGGALGSTLILRMDSTNGDQSLGARTDYPIVQAYNTSSSSDRTITLGTGGSQTLTLVSLSLTKTGSNALTVDDTLYDPTLTVTGDITIGSGTTLLASNSAAFHAKGNYTNNGSFTDNGGTVTLSGTSQQTLSGTMTGSTADFNNLVITNNTGMAFSGCATSFTPSIIFAASATISGTYTITTASVGVQYNSGSTYTVTNIDFNGQAAGTRIIFRNSNLTSGTWALNVSGTQSVLYVDVARSNATGGNQIVATGGTNVDCNNNTNWLFVTGVTISGHIYTNDGSTPYDCSAGNLTVAIKVDGLGSYSGSCTLNTGAYSVSPVTVGSGTTITAYISGATPKAATVSRANDGVTDITDLDLYQNRVIARHEDAGPAVMADFSDWTNVNDADVPFTTGGGDLNFSSGIKLYVWAGKTLSISGGGSSLTTTAASTAANPDGDIYIATGATLSMGTNGLTVGGDLVNAGTLSLSSGQTTIFTATGTGFTITPGGTNFRNVTFNGSGGGWSFSSSATILQNLAMTAGTLSGTNDLTVNGVPSGAGTITLTGGTFLNRVAAAQNFGSTSGSNNWTFNNLTFENSSGVDRTVTFASGGSGQVIVSGALTIGNGSDSNVTTIDNNTNDRIIDANGSVSITSKGKLIPSSTASFTVAGDWANNGDFDASGGGTVTFDGAAQQTLSGQMTGSSDRFADLTISNASGSDPDSSPSVIFGASAETTGTFAATSANTKLRFNAASTYTFQNINFNGQATGTRVFLRSSTPDTAWNINVAGTRTVSNTNVKDSYACGQPPDIDASDGTNVDAIGNSCWLINTISFSLSHNALYFGALRVGSSCFAQNSNPGDVPCPQTSEAEAMNIVAASSAANGYIITLTNSGAATTLTSGGNTIDAIGSSNVASNPGNEQFGFRASATGGSGSVSAPYTASGYALDTAAFPDVIATTSAASAATTYSLRWIANIAAQTEAGSYSASYTFIMTSKY